MIRNDSEYRKAVKRLQEEKARLDETRAELEEQGLSQEGIKRVMDPLISFHLQLKEEVQSYDRLKRGEFDELINLGGIGHLLVCLRIARGITQTELAERLGVSQTQVSRDERNEYHGVTVDRASKILKALGAKMQSEVKLVQPAAA